MGIQGLLPLLKSIHKPTHLRNFAGQTLGVDAYGWLHRGTVSCAIELAQGKPTRKHIEFTLSRVRMLIHFGVKPYLVFDGDYLPSKASTERERATRRKESEKMGLELLRMGRVSQAHLELQKSVDVTPIMAKELIEELKRMDVPYIVAPYEADSQMAYLEASGVIDGIISEDSDLLVFGAKCLLTKLDQYGECVMINRADFTACRDISLVGWTDREFRMMSMLSGCDYLAGIEKMGLKTAYRLVTKHKSLDRIVRAVQFDGKMKVPHGYIEAFTAAERTFLYQWVFCPLAMRVVNLNKVPAGLEIADMPYIGTASDVDVATAVAYGDLDPNSKERLVLPERHAQPQVRTRVVQTPDGKEGRSISEFFKPRRTPLAELDPNSFTPSPSQQRLLEGQRTTSWSASQVEPSRGPALRRASSTTAPSSAPQAARRTVSEQTPTRQQTSPKRQRLCSEGMFASSMNGSVGLQSATSRFFAKHTAQASPSLRKTSKSRLSESFELYSDDAGAEGTTSIATEGVTASSPKKRKKLAVFTDDQMSKTNELEASQTTTSTMESQESQDSRQESDTPATSFESVFSAGLNASFSEMKQKWAFKPAIPKPAMSESKNAMELLENHDSSAQDPLLDTRGSQSKDHPSAVDDGEVVEVPTSSPILAPTDATAGEGIKGEESLATERRQATPDPLLDIKGSEDLLVPNSPGSESDERKPRPTLNLGRFAFAG
ncbi:PIN domain-like protein [Hortaea werneckii]|nr:PIN domain-like protein [Hortaea werneckii]KAI7013453.1 PIN domain-like protein [Hortaea werneckii]